MLAAWAGLGYYARARNLHACAREVVARHGGQFPDDEAGLRELPGIGDYTAAAIAAIAFGKRATPVDGNIERVVARLFAVTTPLPAAKTEIRALAETLTPETRARRFRPGDDGSWAPRSARRAGRLAASARCGPTAAAMPRVSPRRCLIARRRASGRCGAAQPSLPFAPMAPCCCASGRCRACLGGMLETPSSPWEEAEPGGNSARRYAPVAAEWRKLPGLVEHTFTHFHLELSVYRAEVGLDAAAEARGGALRAAAGSSRASSRAPRCRR